MNIDAMKEKLKALMGDERFVHSLGVMSTAGELAARFGADVEKARIAGLLHDCAKEVGPRQLLSLCPGEDCLDMEDMPAETRHALLGARLAKCFFGVRDGEILSAIRNHTVADEDMSLLSEIVYLADIIEPGRGGGYTNELRRLAEVDLKAALLAAYDASIITVIRKGRPLHFATIAARNKLISKG